MRRMVRKMTVPAALLLGVAFVCAGWAPPAWAEDDDGFTVQKQGDKTIKFKKKTSFIISRPVLTSRTSKT